MKIHLVLKLQNEVPASGENVEILIFAEVLTRIRTYQDLVQKL